MAPSASAHRRAAGTWPTTISTALWTMVYGALVPISPASMGAASRSSGSVTTEMIVVTTVMSWKVFVVSWILGSFAGTKVAFMQVFGAECCCVGKGIQSVPKHPVRTEKHLL